MRANIGIGLPSNLSPTLTQRALAILRKYGTDAHLWLPGVGVVNGITAGNFSDTAGTTPAVVDSTAGVGLVVDAGGGTINATQGTTAAKPILRQSSGRYSWQFDGTDDRLQLSAVPFQMADDHCVVAAARPAALSGVHTVFSTRNSADANPVVCSLRFDTVSNRVRSAYRDNAGALVFVDGPTGISASTQYVASCRRASGMAATRVNGVGGTPVWVAGLGATTLNAAAIGVEPLATPTQFMNGNIGPVIAIKGTVSDADLMTLEKWVGSLSGVTI